MDINFENDIVTLSDKNIKLDTLVKKLTELSGVQVYYFLSNRGISVPKRINCYALISVLNRKIKFLHSNSLSKDYFTRLKHYKYFTEHQLFTLFKKICDDEASFYLYRYNFFKLLLINFVSMNFSDAEITYLKNLKKGEMESFDQYYNYISSVALEQEDTFDGQNIDDLKEMLAVSASNQELFDIAGKYGIDLPSKLKKEQYLDFIYYYMQNNRTYNEEIAEELSVMTITQLQTYAKRTGIPMQPNMSKNEMITYLFYFVEQCELAQTSIRRIEISDEYLPLEFKIDFSVLNTFGSGEDKRIIYYQGYENDSEELNEIIMPNSEEILSDEELAEIPVDKQYEESEEAQEDEFEEYLNSLEESEEAQEDEFEEYLNNLEESKEAQEDEFEEYLNSLEESEEAQEDEFEEYLNSSEESKEAQEDEFEEYLNSFEERQVSDEEANEYSEEYDEEIYDEADLDEYEEIDEFAYEGNPEEYEETYADEYVEYENVEGYEELEDYSSTDSYEGIEEYTAGLGDYYDSSVDDSSNEFDELLADTSVVKMKSSVMKKQDFVEEDEQIKHFDDVRVNKDYGNPKLEHVADGPTKKITAGIILGIVAAIVIACVVILLK